MFFNCVVDRWRDIARIDIVVLNNLPAGIHVLFEDFYRTIGIEFSVHDRCMVRSLYRCRPRSGLGGSIGKGVFGYGVRRHFVVSKLQNVTRYDVFDATGCGFIKAAKFA